MNLLVARIDAHAPTLELWPRQPSFCAVGLLTCNAGPAAAAAALPVTAIAMTVHAIGHA